MTVPYSISIAGKLTKDQESEIQILIDTTFADVNTIFNYWNPESEVSQLNRLKAGEKRTLSQALYNHLKDIDSFIPLTQGKFDPTIGSLQKLWRSYLDKGCKPPVEEIAALKEKTGWQHVYFEEGVFSKDFDELALDLGAVAKGHCVDMLYDRLLAWGCQNFLVDWGAEIRTHGRHSPERPWMIGIRDPEHGGVLTAFPLENRAVATSGDYWQKWTVNDTEVYTHIINPQTGWALSQFPITSASVIADTCAMADALATGGMIFDTVEEAEKWANDLQQENPRLTFNLIPR